MFFDIGTIEKDIGLKHLVMAVNYQKVLEDFLKVSHTAQIKWLARNNRVINPKTAYSKEWLIIANPYRNCITAFIRANNKAEYKDLDFSDKLSMFQVLNDFPERSVKWNSMDNRSIKDRFHFHMSHDKY